MIRNWLVRRYLGLHSGGRDAENGLCAVGSSMLYAVHGSVVSYTQKLALCTGQL